MATSSRQAAQRIDPPPNRDCSGGGFPMTCVRRVTRTLSRAVGQSCQGAMWNHVTNIIISSQADSHGRRQCVESLWVVVSRSISSAETRVSTFVKHRINAASVVRSARMTEEWAHANCDASLPHCASCMLPGSARARTLGRCRSGELSRPLRFDGTARAARGQRPCRSRRRPGA